MRKDCKTVEEILTQWENTRTKQDSEYQQEVYNFLLALDTIIFKENHCEFEKQKLLLIQDYERLVRIIKSEFKNMDDVSETLAIKLIINLHSLCRNYTSSPEDTSAMLAAEKFFRKEKISYEICCPYCGHFFTLEEALNTPIYRRSRFSSGDIWKCPACQCDIHWSDENRRLEYLIYAVTCVILAIISFKTKSVVTIFMLIILAVLVVPLGTKGFDTINYYFSYIARDDFKTKLNSEECHNKKETNEKK